MKSKTRAYTMGARARAAEVTGERIVDAMFGLFGALPYDRIRLEDVAAEAGVTVQTVLRRFGSKAGLLTATVEREFARVAAARAAASGATPAETVGALVEFYEDHALPLLKVYAEAQLVDGLPALADRARAYHVDWCRRVFADQLDDGGDAATRARRLAQVIAVCDATTWRVLRLDGGLTSTQTARAMLELLMPLLRAPESVTN